MFSLVTHYEKTRQYIPFYVKNLQQNITLIFMRILWFLFTSKHMQQIDTNTQTPAKPCNGSWSSPHTTSMATFRHFFWRLPSTESSELNCVTTPSSIPTGGFHHQLQVKPFQCKISKNIACASSSLLWLSCGESTPK